MGKLVKKLQYLIVTVFGVGYLPYAPGTWGSLVAAYIIWLIGTKYILFYAIILIVLGAKLSSNIESDSNQKDPKYIVIDEVAGMFVALAFLPHKLSVFIIGFILFRIFDISKIQPAKFFEKIPNGYGIMLDDVVSGIYTNILLQILTKFNII